MCCIMTKSYVRACPFGRNIQFPEFIILSLFSLFGTYATSNIFYLLSATFHSHLCTSRSICAVNCYLYSWNVCWLLIYGRLCFTECDVQHNIMLCCLLRHLSCIIIGQIAEEHLFWSHLSCTTSLGGVWQQQHSSRVLGQIARQTASDWARQSGSQEVRSQESTQCYCSSLTAIMPHSWVACSNILAQTHKCSRQCQRCTSNEWIW